MRNLHLAHYLVPIGAPLLLISAVIGWHLDKIMERPKQARTALSIVVVAVSAIVGLVTLAVTRWMR